jgi:hypothetical protein
MDKRRALLLGLTVLCIVIILVAPACKSKKDKKKDKAEEKAAIAETSTITNPPAVPADPTCTDRIRNGGELGVDCGGPNCPQTCCEKAPEQYCPENINLPSTGGLPGAGTPSGGTGAGGTGGTTGRNCGPNDAIPSYCQQNTACCNCQQDVGETGVDCGGYCNVPCPPPIHCCLVG